MISRESIGHGLAGFPVGLALLGSSPLKDLFLSKKAVSYRIKDLFVKIILNI